MLGEREKETKEVVIIEIYERQVISCYMDV